MFPSPGSDRRLYVARRSDRRRRAQGCRGGWLRAAGRQRAWRPVRAQKHGALLDLDQQHERGDDDELFETATTDDIAPVAAGLPFATDDDNIASPQVAADIDDGGVRFDEAAPCDAHTTSGASSDAAGRAEIFGSVQFGRISDSDLSDLVVLYVRSLRTYSHAQSPLHFTVGICINVLHRHMKEQILPRLVSR